MPRMRSPHHTDVFSQLPSRLMHELDDADVAAVLADLVEAGWRPGQLRSRIGAEPSLGSPDRDAQQVLDVLRRLREQTPPDIAHARELERRRRAREDERATAPRPASPETAGRSAQRIRTELGLLPARRPAAEPRTRPSCSLCDGEGSFFVSRDVHLCPRCVEVLASGEARLVATG